MSVGQGLCILPQVTKTILCFTVKCPTNISISNGYLTLNENETSVTYQCANGFRLVGSASATCKKDGTWNSPPPKCAGMTLSVANI